MKTNKKGKNRSAYLFRKKKKMGKNLSVYKKSYINLSIYKNETNKNNDMKIGLSYNCYVHYNQK